MRLKNDLIAPKSSAYGINRARIVKRIAASFLDFAIFVIFATGIGTLFSLIIHYNDISNQLEAKYEEYGMRTESGLICTVEYSSYVCKTAYGSFTLDQEIPASQYITFSEEEKHNWKGESFENDPCYLAQKVFYEDEEAMELLKKANSLILLNITVSVFIGTFVTYFIFPLIFKNGQTLGNKIMRVGVLSNKGIKINNVQLFMRSLIGTYAIDYMIPIYGCMLVFVLTDAGIIGLIVLFVWLCAQIGVFVATPNRLLLHDIVAGTVAVEIDGQAFFDTKEELEAKIKEENEARKAADEKYKY